MHNQKCLFNSYIPVNQNWTVNSFMKKKGNENWLIDITIVYQNLELFWNNL